MKIINQNCIQEEIKSRLNSGTASCPSPAHLPSLENFNMLKTAVVTDI